jgi:CubicO group peptidase (beta-lactamase class C family)
VPIAGVARTTIGLAAWLAWASSATAATVVAVDEVDALFSAWTSATPGCAVGVSRDGEILLERAYGMADLEHDVRNAPDTVFEAGSVSKQFTAAAVLLLARDGKLSLDDPARKYLPELPGHAASITLRQMLHHTSGLRDWGSIEDVAGWPRSTRVYTHAHVLDIASRQSRLNFPPGSNWSYTNTGYNLAVEVVSRVAGQPFAEFTRKRIFEPLGMTRSSWRDDYKRIVKGRAIAYEEAAGEYRTDMPFENVHGNGGLLTTVGDLLRWSENFSSPKVGDAAFVQELQAPGRLSDGRALTYALGLRVGEYKGLREVSHSGTTASYRAYLARYPDERLSIALLCNAGNSTPRETLHAVADLYLSDSLKPSPIPAPSAVGAAELDALTGTYRNTGTGAAAIVTRDGDALRIDDGPPLVALSPRRFADGDGLLVEFSGDGGARLDFGDGTFSDFERVDRASPTVTDLQALAGSYSSDDAEVTLMVEVRDGFLEIVRRPDSRFRLTPLYADAFECELGTIIFRRDGSGRPVEFSVVRERVWDLRFGRRSPDSG